MSKWYVAEDEDIEVDWNENQVDFLVCSDRDGNIYTSLSFDQIRKIAEKIDAPR